MAQSPTLRYYNGLHSNSNSVGRPDKEAPAVSQDSTNQPDNVQGWLMNLHSYRGEAKEPSAVVSTIVDADNNSIPTDTRKNRNGRPESIASEDSVNLDELINANFTADMDDETDLPNLADLDLDDSAEDFWKLDSNEPLNKFDAGFNDIMTKSVELDWSPTSTNDTATSPTTPLAKTPSINMLKSSLPVTPSSEFASRYKKTRSDSFSSENSLTSQSTITQYAKYGLTPMIHPSESSSTSSRSLSRLSNYSTASSSTTSGIPHPRTNSTSNTNANTNGGGIPTPSRSYTHREANGKSKGHLSPPGSTTQQRTKLAKRASHIPAPASSAQQHYNSPPSPQRTISSSSASNSSTLNRIPTSTTKRIPQQRASHIPTVRESIHRPGSPLNNHIGSGGGGTNSGRSSKTPSRIGMRSPTPAGGPRNSLFGPSQQQSNNNNTTTTTSKQQTSSSSRPMTPTRDEKARVMSPTTNRPSGLRPPGSVASSVRSISRIGTVKKPSTSS